MRYLTVLVLVALCGCAAVDSGWRYTMPDYKPEIVIQKVSYEELGSICTSPANLTVGVKACADMQPKVCMIYLGPKADECSLKHELKHCAGWTHVWPLGGCG